MKFIWDLLNDLSSIMILAFISVSTPGLVSNIQRAILSFIYIDLLQTDKWLPALFFKATEEDEPLTAYFELNGYSSMTLIKNLGSTFLFLLLLVLLHLVYGILAFFN